MKFCTTPMALAWFLIIALAECALPQPSAAQDFGGLNGTWEGSLNYVQGPGLAVSKTTTSKWTKLIIAENSARAFYMKDNNIIEIKPGKFKIERAMTNAIVFAVDTGKDSDGTWVQNWLYALTEKDHDTLIVNHLAMANNLNVPLSNSSSKWSSAATGELKRVK
jgi:hypothetical protein